MKVMAYLMVILALFGVSSAEALTLSWSPSLELSKHDNANVYVGIEVLTFQDITLESFIYRYMGYPDTIWLIDNDLNILDEISIPAADEPGAWPPSSYFVESNWELAANTTYYLIGKGIYTETDSNGYTWEYLNLVYDEYRGYGIYNTSFESGLDYAENEHLRVIGKVQYNLVLAEWWPTTYTPNFSPQFWYGFDHLTTAVPEPTTLLLLGLGLMGLGVMRKKI